MPPESTTAAARFAGQVTAHAVWSLADSKRLTCLVGFRTADGSGALERMRDKSHRANVAEAERRLDEPAEGVACGVMIYDGYVTAGESKSDALIITAREYGSGGEGQGGTDLRFALPYQPASEDGPLEFGKLKFLDVPAAYYHQLASTFFEGVGRHADAVAFWRSHSRVVLPTNPEVTAPTSEELVPSESEADNSSAHPDAVVTEEAEILERETEAETQADLPGQAPSHSDADLHLPSDED